MLLDPRDLLGLDTLLQGPLSSFLEAAQGGPAPGRGSSEVARGGGSGGQLLKLDIQESDRDFVVYADVPGIQKNACKVEYDSDRHTVHITLYQPPSSQTQQENYHYLRQERITPTGAHRAVRLPRNVDGQQISAKINDGLLSE